MPLLNTWMAAHSSQNNGNFKIGYGIGNVVNNGNLEMSFVYQYMHSFDNFLRKSNLLTEMISSRAKPLKR